MHSHSSCPTPWKKWFATEWEAEERLAQIMASPDSDRYPQRVYECPYMEIDSRGGRAHFHMTSVTEEVAN